MGDHGPFFLRVDSHVMNRTGHLDAADDFTALRVDRAAAVMGVVFVLRNAFGPFDRAA